MLTTPDKVREYIGLTSSDAPDNLLEQYIARAQREFLNDVAVYVRDDTLTGNIDGVNSTFWLTYPHVADRNFDGEVDPPKEMPWQGIWHPEAPSIFDSIEEYLDWYEGYKKQGEDTVGLLFYRTAWIENNARVEEAVIKEFEKRGKELRSN